MNQNKKEMRNISVKRKLSTSQSHHNIENNGPTYFYQPNVESESQDSKDFQNRLKKKI